MPPFRAVSWLWYNFGTKEHYTLTITYMSSNLDVKQGIYDPTKRFEFKNITDKEFIFYWNSTPIKVQAGEAIELPHHLAVLATKNIVDLIMNTEVRAEEAKVRAEKNNPYWQSPKALGLGVPAIRETVEKQVLRELSRSESKITESQMGIIRSELKETLVKDLKGENSPTITKMSDIGVTDVKAFEDINMPETAK